MFPIGDDNTSRRTVPLDCCAKDWSMSNQPNPVDDEKPGLSPIQPRVPCRPARTPLRGRDGWTECLLVSGVQTVCESSMELGVTIPGHVTT
jgi:hypothetical protein